MSRELVIYCDESDQSGRNFSNFYGGLLVESIHLDEVERRIHRVREATGLTREVKWQKISAGYAERYRLLIDEVFDLASERKLKIRIMFTPSQETPRRLTTEQRDNGFFLLYYQFIKWAFGLQFAGNPPAQTRIRLMFDKFPDTREKSDQFKHYLAALSKGKTFRNARLLIEPTSIAEIDSKDHALLQCIDVVLGAIQFRLNDKHLETISGSDRRGNRTVAKESVYLHIEDRIRELIPTFSIDKNTIETMGQSSRWHQPYRHWLFQAKK